MEVTRETTVIVIPKGAQIPEQHLKPFFEINRTLGFEIQSGNNIDTSKYDVITEIVIMESPNSKFGPNFKIGNN